MKVVFLENLNLNIIVGQITGSSDDWARGQARVKYTYTLELAPGENDPDFGFGFALPEDRFFICLCI